MSTTNVLFVNGQYDPWRALSIAADVDPAEPGNIITTTIPAAGEALPKGTVFGYVVQNGLHSSDFNYSRAASLTNTTILGGIEESVNGAHELFASALSSWLPAYTKFAPTNPTSTSTATGTATSSPTTKSSASREIMLWSAWALMALSLGLTFLAWY
jgi:hypothetical protein